MKETTLFGSLYNQYYTVAFRFVKFYVRIDMAAEDIVSDSFFKLWEIMKREEVNHPYALLTTILRHESLDWLKHEQIKQASIETITSIQTRDLHYRILSLGKTNTIFAWDTPLPDVAEPAVWFHDVFRRNGEAYSMEEIGTIKGLTGEE